MPVYSFSQINVYTTCPRKYSYKYVEKIPEGDSEMSPDLFLGKAVHEVLEVLYKRLNELQKPTLEECLARFDTLWSDRDDSAIILKEGQTKESYYRRGVLYITEYRQKHAPFTDVRVIATEAMITFSLDKENGLQFRGVIDRLDKEGKVLIINDYKTNKSLPPESRDHYQEQLTLYGLAVRQQYGKYGEKITAKLHYLHFDTVDEWEITDELLEPVIEKYSGLVKEIEQKRFHHNMGDGDQFPPIENPFCRFCAYQSICPLWAHSSMDDQIVLGESTVRDLVDEYSTISKQASELEKQKKSLKKTLEEYLQQTGLKKLFGHDYAITVSTRPNYSVENHDQLLEAIRTLGKEDEVLRIDRFALARLIKEGGVSEGALPGMNITESVTLRTGKNKQADLS